MPSASQRHKCEIHGRSSIGNSDCPPYGGAGGQTMAGQAVVWGSVIVQPLVRNAAMTPVDFDGFTSGSDPISYAVTTGTLPTGLTLSAAGVLSGTPTGLGDTTGLVVTGTNASGGVASGPFTISVVAA